MIKTKINNNIEALRGFCALMVLLSHFIFYNHVINNNNAGSFRIPYEPLGHMMVMVFFMLSGYVIGLSSPIGDKFFISDYLKRRLVRLYPIYIVAILITIAFFKEAWPSIIGTSLFVQNLFVDVLDHNQALWSLNHEVLFYLLAIPIIKFSVKPKYVFCLLILILVVVVKINCIAIVQAYVVGFIFWMTGFALSKLKLNTTASPAADSGKLLSVFFLLLTAGYFNTDAIVWGTLLNRLHITEAPSRHVLDVLVNVNDFGLYLLGLYGVCIAASIKQNWVKFLTIAVFVFAWVRFLFVIFNGSIFKTDIFYVPGVCLLLSTTLYFVKKEFPRSVALWTSAGSISYALYVIHTPILLAMGKVTFFSGTLLTFLVKIIIGTCVVVALSYLLEKKLQPLIKNYFFPKKPVPLK